MLSHVRLFVTPWTIAHQGPLSMGSSKQECWNGLPFPPPGDLPKPGIKPTSPELAGGFFTTKTPGKPEKGGTLSKSGQGTQDLQDREYKQGRRLQSSYSQG